MKKTLIQKNKLKKRENALNIFSVYNRYILLKTLRQIVLPKIYNYKIFAETERSVSLKLNIETI